MDTGQTIRITLTGLDSKSIDIATKKITDIAAATGGTFKVAHLPNRKKKGATIHKQQIDIANATNETVDGLMKLVLEKGIEVEINL